MISFDTNLLLYSLNQDCLEHHNARAFFASLPTAPGTVAVCELVLIELYVLLRNPAVLSHPLEPAETLSPSFKRSANIRPGSCLIIRAIPLP